MQERGKINAGTLGIAEFSVSNGYIESFIRCNKTQRSVMVHGRGGSAVPSNYEQRMEEIQSVSANYQLRNIYDMDESSLFYRTSPRTSFTLPSEKARTVRGTELQKQKVPISIVLSCNADGSYTFPVRYIRNAKKPRCYRDNQFLSLKNMHSSQKNSWVDRNQFDEWIH